LSRQTRCAFDASSDDARHEALIRAAKRASANGQLVAWDNSKREYAIALYHEQTHQLQPLTDEEAAILLNRDSLIRRAWRRWHAASKSGGSLIIIDGERIKGILESARDEPEDDDEMKGLA
jgi:hypothetical protein